MIPPLDTAPPAPDAGAAPSDRPDAGPPSTDPAARPVVVAVPPGEAERAEAAAWAEVVAAWNDEERHRAYLARFDDLEGLAAAGGRYRDALAARPGDPVASRFRDEVVRRAVARGLASLPREPAPDRRARLAVRVAAGAVLAALLLAAALMAARLLPFLSGGAPP